MIRLLSWLTHYVSTYCMHRDHDKCRRTCKTCGRVCRCRCHKRLAVRLPE